MDKRKVGNRIKQARMSCGLTQAQLAEEQNLTPKYISNIETGYRLPQLETFVSLANVLNCSADVLLADVLSAPANVKPDSITERLASLSAEERRRILRAIDFMINDSKANPQ